MKPAPLVMWIAEAIAGSRPQWLILHTEAERYVYDFAIDR
jgi:hypothetical protein